MSYDLKPDVVTYTTLMKTLIRVDKFYKVPAVYEEMILSRCTPDRKARAMLRSLGSNRKVRPKPRKSKFTSNYGPQFLAAHGVSQSLLETNGEVVERAEPHPIGPVREEAADAGLFLNIRVQ
ncbi:hypothetical protein Prudu_003101 [Prunus dulcis]|uniref:Pentatricopeptide repeat superfamily protein n=1 Tax=Prunus dulcis TaxID=3755 RepID=A0A4Y1QS93_PRUDU|nr:hypothetical protein Prudu_003101 [Prunus dulcis]